jgi:hypothetical protein
MKPTFQTKRLDVFKVECERSDGFASPSLYLAFPRDIDGNVYPWHHSVECATLDDTCVVWIETLHNERQGYALDLLNGIIDYERLEQPMRPDMAISKASESLFKKHEKWFHNRNPPNA